uniref:Ig-like domain-containing protein n=1 Tax=Astyanax mexicanus TaxID=7994 RepID=A0A8B9GVS4_ASTMX
MISALLYMGTLGVEVEQNELSWTKLLNKRVDIKCRVTGLQTTYVHWYQQKDGEALTRMLYVNAAGTSPVYNPDRPEAEHFSVRLEGVTYVLKVSAVQMIHTGVYYCACWDRSNHSDLKTSYPVH